MDCKVIRGLDNLAGQAAGGVLTIGNFDGVHIGHQRLLAEARQLADGAGERLCVMTFDPPPAEVLAPARAPERILPPELKYQYIGDCGAEIVVVVETTAEFLAASAEEFVRRAIVEGAQPRHVVEGHNFFFGRGREGNIELLERLAGQFDFEVTEVSPAMLALPGRDEQRVSSSLVRELIRAGEIAAAAQCLSRPFTLYGRVVGGERRGRLLDFPTANVDADGLIVPADGVYAGRVRIDSLECPAAISIGDKPTFAANGSPRVIEANLIDAVGDFYDRPIAVTFIERLRGQEKFPGAESLAAQIAKDVQRVREICR